MSDNENIFVQELEKAKTGDVDKLLKKFVDAPSQMDEEVREGIKGITLNILKIRTERYMKNPSATHYNKLEIAMRAYQHIVKNTYYR